MTESRTVRGGNRFLWRIKLIVTRRVTWVPVSDDIEQTPETYRENWRVVRHLALPWTISSNWKWIQRFGRMECGCTRNPITRRMVLYVWRCPIHMAWANKILETDNDTG